MIALLLSACSSQDKNNPIENEATLDYVGKDGKAILTIENSMYFVELLNTGFFELDFNASCKVGTIGMSLTDINAINSDSKTGKITGKVSISIEKVNQYESRITYDYKNFSDLKDLILDGKLINYFTVDNKERITKCVSKYQLLNVKQAGEDTTIKGTVSVSAIQTEISVLRNYIVKNNNTKEMIKYNNFRTLLNPQGKNIEYSGQIYNSNYGYVNAHTLVPVAYNEDDSPKIGTKVSLEGDASTITIKHAYNNRVRIEIDSDNDGTSNTVQIYMAGNFKKEIENSSPIININFPQNIYSDTDMSQVTVDIYDPDLDGFSTHYEWKINNIVERNTLELDSKLFKKHDILQLTVTADDDRKTNSKSSTKSKLQEVLDTYLPIEASLNVDGGKVEYFTNEEIATMHSGYDKAIIVIHGTNRNSDDYYNYIVNAIEDENNLNHTLILAPRFQTLADDPNSDELYWSNSGWKKGFKSKNINRTPSFEVIDLILDKINSNFEKITSITIVGHSAGAQFVQRYAALNESEQMLRQNLKLRYVIANPSSYVYLTSYRPKNTDNCVDYDNYKYGLANIPEILHYTNLTKENIQNQLISRSIYLLLGQEDNNIDSNNLDTSCKANTQGFNRYDRGIFYYKHIKDLNISANHIKVEVEGIGHNAEEMFNSSKGREIIFFSTP